MRQVFVPIDAITLHRGVLDVGRDPCEILRLRHSTIKFPRNEDHPYHRARGVVLSNHRDRDSDVQFVTSDRTVNTIPSLIISHLLLTLVTVHLEFVGLLPITLVGDGAGGTGRWRDQLAGLT